MPGQGNMRKRRTKTPAMSSNGDTTVIKYAALGTGLGPEGTGITAAATFRLYVPGFATNITNAVGPSIVNYYSTGVFKAGTAIRWEPSVSFTTPGRVYCAFTDNPEATVVFSGLSLNNRLAYIKGCGTMRSFPVWQETTVPFPLATRRKKFDTNTSVALDSEDVLDRCMQTAFLYAVEGTSENTICGSFWYHDTVLVEGVQPVAL